MYEIHLQRQITNMSFHMVKRSVRGAAEVVEIEYQCVVNQPHFGNTKRLNGIIFDRAV